MIEDVGGHVGTGYAGATPRAAPVRRLCGDCAATVRGLSGARKPGARPARTRDPGAAVVSGVMGTTSTNADRSSPATSGPPAAALDAGSRLARYTQAFAGLEAPFAFVDLDAMHSNAAEMLARVGGKPIRLASKSLRCRGIQRLLLDRYAGLRGQLTYTLPETLWLDAEGFENLLLAYPSVDRGALHELARRTREQPRALRS